MNCAPPATPVMRTSDVLDPSDPPEGGRFALTRLFLSAAEYKTLCPGGEGFRPNPITVILEGK